MGARQIFNVSEHSKLYVYQHGMPNYAKSGWNQFWLKYPTYDDDDDMESILSHEHVNWNLVQLYIGRQHKYATKPLSEC
jgi:hypothetical protein